jgi:hypothetical protein
MVASVDNLRKTVMAMEFGEISKAFLPFVE